MTHDTLEEFLLSLPNARRDDMLDSAAIGYRVGEQSDAPLFAVIEKDSKPLRVSLKCDPLLAKTLRERFETVVSARNLDRKVWNTIVCTGQLPDNEIFDLARLSHRLVTEAQG